MSAGSTMPRTPLMISAGDLVVGPIHAVFRDGDRESLLHNYLVLIRELRGEQRQQRLILRGEDISALAVHLGTSEQTVLGDLLDLMGATRAQRMALFTLFAAGALTMVATGSIALNMLPTGAAADRALATAAVVATEDLTPSTVTDARATNANASDALVAVSPAASVASDDPPIEPASVAADATDFAEAIASTVAAPAQLVSPAELRTPDAPSIEVAARPVDGVGVADDGSIVAVAQPPSPPAERGQIGEGVADDGSIVAVAPPPVPSIEGVGITDDGSTVAVAPPPVAPG